MRSKLTPGVNQPLVCHIDLPYNMHINLTLRAVVKLVSDLVGAVLFSRGTALTMCGACVAEFRAYPSPFQPSGMGLTCHQKPGTNRSATAAYSVPLPRMEPTGCPTNRSRSLSWAATDVRLGREVTPLAAHTVLDPDPVLPGTV